LYLTNECLIVDGRWYFHNGIDIALERGTEVIASTSGRVSQALLSFCFAVFSSEFDLYTSGTHLVVFFGHIFNFLFL